MNVGLPLWLAFMLTVAVSFAGALSAVVIQFVAPDSFSMFLSIYLLVGVVVGGTGWLAMAP